MTLVFLTRDMLFKLDTILNLPRYVCHEIHQTTRIPSYPGKEGSRSALILLNKSSHVKSLQRLVGKCVSFSLVVPGALLFTREMNNAVFKAQHTSKPIKLHDALREEIWHWLFFRAWDDPLPWRDERHIRISLRTDASASGWGCSVTLGGRTVETDDYWTKKEQELDISVKKALALDKVLLSFSDSLKKCMGKWPGRKSGSTLLLTEIAGRSMSLNRAIKKLFFTTTKLNIALHLMCIPSKENEADAPSSRLTTLDCKLHPRLWQRYKRSPKGQTCDLMALDSNSMTHQDGSPLPHFTAHSSSQSYGVNFFAQGLSSGVPFLEYTYIFPSLFAVLRFLRFHRRLCTVIALDVYPRTYWWHLIKSCARKSCTLAVKGEVEVPLLPYKQR